MRTWEEANEQFSDKCAAHPGIECELELQCASENGCDHCKQAAGDYERHRMDNVRATVLKLLNDFASENSGVSIHYSISSTAAEWRKLSLAISEAIK